MSTCTSTWCGAYTSTCTHGTVLD